MPKRNYSTGFDELPKLPNLVQTKVKLQPRSNIQVLPLVVSFIVKLGLRSNHRGAKTSQSYKPDLEELSSKK